MSALVSRLPAIGAFFLVAAIGSGQTPRHPVISPDVHPDGSVTLRFDAPHAREVEVSLETVPANLLMRRGQDGVWSVTTPPLEPDFYGYNFVADGVALLDPNNPDVKPNLLYPANQVHVPGSSSLSWEVGPVPHGEVTHHLYHSGVLATESDYYVYTPPGYASSHERYPVLYLLHGYSDQASGWTAVGRANVTFDNLIAEGKAKPMVVVMPLGYGFPQIVERGSGQTLSDAAAQKLNYDRFRTILLSEVLPAVEGEYRILAGPAHRAIAGLSMGGAESLLIGLNTPETFSAVGAFSTGGLPPDFAASFPALPGLGKGTVRLLWIACGTDDPRLKVSRALRAWLSAQGVSHTDIETPGAHTWPVWRRNLTAFAPLLFRN